LQKLAYLNKKELGLKYMIYDISCLLISIKYFYCTLLIFWTKLRFAL